MTQLIENSSYSLLFRIRGLFLHLLLVITLAFIFTSTARGANRDNPSDLRMSCYFTYPSNSSVVHPDLGNNVLELERLDQFIRDVLQTDSISIRRIRLTGYCSIEGDSEHNITLSRERVEGFHDYLYRVYPALYRYPVDLAWVGEDWTNFSTMLSRSTLSAKTEALAIIHRHSNPSDRKRLLYRLNGGVFYKQIEQRFFPLLRRVEITVEYASDPTQPKNLISSQDPMIYNVLGKRSDALVPDSSRVWEAARVLEVDRISSDSTVVTFTTSSLRNDLGLVSVNRINKRSATEGIWVYPRFAIKSNLLYWAGITPDADRTTWTYNLSVEYFLSHCWSVEAGFRYGNRSYNGGREYQGVSGYYIEPRYNWRFPSFSAVSLYLGVYGRFGDYDVRRLEDDANASSNYTGKYWDAGLSSGIHFRLYRGWGLEAGCRSGYVHSRSMVYKLHDGHNCFERYEPYDKVVVTDLILNLVYRF
ncbi:DUF3575 domain-containing protein [Bacteroides sp. 51]|uniref:DUF3575 domain-containing protein n=1 Tax=Bacteroides sp. 51 TaxID=2302938 RepID=UPI0013D4C91F|nr:DUF3575 domain-containing protein [Bacteroides sp. 51]NDV84357.1 DUF3575 domain-containing protein [Bacteroides sp. 51]